MEKDWSMLANNQKIQSNISKLWDLCITIHITPQVTSLSKGTTMSLNMYALLAICMVDLSLAAGYQVSNWNDPSSSYDELYDEETELLRALSGAKMSLGGYMQESYGGDYAGDYSDYGYQGPEQRSGGYQQQQQQSGGYGHKSQGYGMKKKRKTYKPVKLPQKKEKKMKIISVDNGFYIAGGTQIFGKFKSLKGCMKACAATPNCFAGDFNPWFGRCYIHSNLTACGTLRAHKKLTHFKKIPCTVPEAPNGLIVLGAQIFKGLEQKGIDSLTDCIKKCATAGAGIQATYDLIANQLCFGIDYDFGSHKCYFHVQNNGNICSDVNPIPTPLNLVANPSTIMIALCPDVTPA